FRCPPSTAAFPPPPRRSLAPRSPSACRTRPRAGRMTHRSWPRTQPSPAPPGAPHRRHARVVRHHLVVVADQRRSRDALAPAIAGLGAVTGVLVVARLPRRREDTLGRAPARRDPVVRA